MICVVANSVSVKVKVSAPPIDRAKRLPISAKLLERASFGNPLSVFEQVQVNCQSLLVGTGVSAIWSFLTHPTKGFRASVSVPKGTGIARSVDVL